MQSVNSFCGITFLDVFRIQFVSGFMSVSVNDGEATTASIAFSGVGHIFLIAASGVMKMYINGVLIDSIAYAGTLAGSFPAIDVYSRIVGGTVKFDEMAYWKDITFISDDQESEFVRALYNNGSGRFYTAGAWR